MFAKPAASSSPHPHTLEATTAPSDYVKPPQHLRGQQDHDGQGFHQG